MLKKEAANYEFIKANTHSLESDTQHRRVLFWVLLVLFCVDVVLLLLAATGLLTGANAAVLQSLGAALLAALGLIFRRGR